MTEISKLEDEDESLKGSFDEEVVAINAEIDKIQSFWREKEEAEAEKAGPPAPIPPKGYKWGGYGSSNGGRLSEGALWDLKALLHMAAKEGDLMEVQLACQLAAESGANMMHLLVEHRNHPEGRNTIHLACESGNSDLLAYLLSYNYDCCDLRDRQGNTPLSIATDRNHKKCVTMLRLRGCQVNRQIYYDFDRQGDMCSECHRAAVGFGGFCELHSEENNAKVIAFNEVKINVPKWNAEEEDRLALEAQQEELAQIEAGL